MTMTATECLLQMCEERHQLEDYQSGVPRWCTGCGDNAILAAVQRLCRDEGLRPEKTVFVSGIGCSSRFPHYMRTYGFHGIHGRALPVAEGVLMARPDLTVFVNTGDGDCCSIGAAHWIHAIRYNMNITVFLHDNQIYGLTKMQASPTSPRGLKSNTTPRGTTLEALQPLPGGIKPILQRFRKVMTIEGNWCDRPQDGIIDEANRRYSALATLLRARYLVDVDCWSEVKGQPIKPRAIRQALAAKLTE